MGHNVDPIRQAADYHGLKLGMGERENNFSGPFLAVERDIARPHYRDERPLDKQLFERGDAAHIQPRRCIRTLGQRGGVFLFAQGHETDALSLNRRQLSFAA